MLALRVLRRLVDTVVHDHLLILLYYLLILLALEAFLVFFFLWRLRLLLVFPGRGRLYLGL